MIKVRLTHDRDEFSRLWLGGRPEESFFDLWPVRECFGRHFNRESVFSVAEREGKLCGVLPLSWIEEKNQFGFFPGETWRGQTWLERNRIIAEDSSSLTALLESSPRPLHLRYLSARDAWALPVDEINYSLRPEDFGRSFERYMGLFSGGSQKRITREISGLEASGVSFRYDTLSDLDIMFELNRTVFGALSYFHDPRFARSFGDLAAWLHDSGMLRVTTVLIGGRAAAVDMAALWRGTVTILAGGADRTFPGVSKIINFHHIKRACAEKHTLDFMCGDFGWKRRFHLTATPLRKLRVPSAGRAATVEESVCEYAV
jgi:hypothetical protein